MSTAPVALHSLLDERGLLDPKQARTFVCRRFTVPDSVGALRIRLAFTPARSHGYKNLLTLSLFDPAGFRGAGHRHAPEQEIVLGERGATPGFVPGPLPPGDWTVEIDCHCVLASQVGGVQFALSVECATAGHAMDMPVAAYLAAGKTTDAAPVEGAGGHASIPEYEPAPAAPAVEARDVERPATVSKSQTPRWLKGDLHFHTQHSDGRWSMDDVVRYVEEFGLDFVATTDHNTTAAYEEVRWALEHAGLPTVVIPAMELTTYWGHANALGLREWIDWRVRGPEGQPKSVGEGPGAPSTRTMADAAAGIHAGGGTFVVNHPRSAGYPACTGCRWELGDATTAYADVVEVWNGPWDRAQNHEGLALWNRWLNAGHHIPASAGTDSHEWPRSRDQMGYTFVHARPDAQDILVAVRHGGGRSYLSSGPRLTSVTTGPGGNSVTYGDLVQDAILRLVANGVYVAERQVRGEGVAVFPEVAAIPSGSWCRAELWKPGTTLLLAMANPVWLD